MRGKMLFLLIPAALLLLFIIYVLIGINGPKSLIVTEYTVTADVADNLRIVQLSDLHGKQFGKGNEDLINAVAAQKPDLILLTGDMIDRSDDGTEPVMELVRRLKELAPVYACNGNHERGWLTKHDVDLKQAYAEAGATLLNAEFVNITVKGTAICLGGESNYYRTPHLLAKDSEEQKREIAFADDFEQADGYRILMCHIPTNWLDWHAVDTRPVDLVLCGHYHGGMFRLFGRSLYAPYVGFLPEYTRGLYVGEKATCVLSAGLAGWKWVPRIYNPPEIVVVDLVKS